MATIGLTLLYLGYGGLLLVWLARGEERGDEGGCVGRWLLPIGVHSYSIYLWHTTVVMLGVPRLERLCGGRLGTWGALAAYGAGSVVVGIAMAKLIEWPALKARERWFPSRAGEG
jgi:peptidoglycan/LPS O-acetylase OafA/YrhL